jgi:hypothetical protein
LSTGGFRSLDHDVVESVPIDVPGARDRIPGLAEQRADELEPLNAVHAADLDGIIGREDESTFQTFHLRSSDRIGYSSPMVPGSANMGPETAEPRHHPHEVRLLLTCGLL